MRPGVVWFGESLPAAAFDAAQRAVRECRVMLVVGTSGAVWPAAGLAGLARRHGARVLIVNPHASEIDDVAHQVLRATAAVALPRLLGAPPLGDQGLLTATIPQSSIGPASIANPNPD